LVIAYAFIICFSVAAAAAAAAAVVVVVVVLRTSICLLLLSTVIVASAVHINMGAGLLQLCCVDVEHGLLKPKCLCLICM
jgi:hypothetical protein